VPGFVSYGRVPLGLGGGITVTTCQDKERTDESSRRAAAGVTGTSARRVDPPAMTEAARFLQF